MYLEYFIKEALKLMLELIARKVVVRKVPVVFCDSVLGGVVVNTIHFSPDRTGNYKLILSDGVER